MFFYGLNAGQSITLERAALEGPDIWFEDRVGANNQDNLYISDRLKCALDEAGMLAPLARDRNAYPKQLKINFRAGICAYFARSACSKGSEVHDHAHTQDTSPSR